MFRKFFSKPVPILPKEKSNIYVIGELSKLIEKLEVSKEDFEAALVHQAAYFHIIDPNDFSASLAGKWIEIRALVGFNNSSKISNAEEMKAPIREKVSKYTQKDIKILMDKLNDLNDRLKTELKM